jgi:hypothetical protein
MLRQLGKIEVFLTDDDTQECPFRLLPEHP